MNKNSLWITVLGLSWSIATASAMDGSPESPSIYQDTILTASEKHGNFLTANYPAKDKDTPDQPSMSLKTMPSRLQVGGDYTHVQIRPHGLPSFNGNLGGAQASYEYRLMDSFYGGLTTSWKEGSTHGSDGKRKLLYIDVQERFGYMLSLCHENLFLTFFTGLGYRHLGHKFIPKTGSVLYFRYNELYVPVGILTDYTVNSWFAFGLDFTWMPQVYPTVSIVPLKGNRWILTETLANFFVDLPLDFTLTKSKKFHLILKPFYERWKDGHSTAETSTGIPLGLPGNAYNFWGVDVNFAYCF